MLIEEYSKRFVELVDEEYTLYDADELLEVSEFWPAHLLSQSIEDEELAITVWGVAQDRVRQMHKKLADPKEWPVFLLDIGRGRSLAVVYRNLPEDEGVDYLLIGDDLAEPIRIATLEGEYQGPGISWRELSTIAGRFVEPGRRARVLLLLSPILGDVEAEEAGCDAYAEAIRVLGGSGDAEGLARLIVSENLQWEPAQWMLNSDETVVCDAPVSPRNPKSRVALKVDSLKTVSRALNV